MQKVTLEITREDLEAYKQDCLADKKGESITCYCAVAKAASRKFNDKATVGRNHVVIGELGIREYVLPYGFFESHIQIFDAYACAETPGGKTCLKTQKLAKKISEIRFPVRVSLQKVRY